VWKRVWFQVVIIGSTMLATASAAMLAYGTDPYWAQFRPGLSLILLTYRLQWVLATLSLVLCLVVVGLIISGRRRVFWLIVLGPVMALFVHRFIGSPMRSYGMMENPRCVKAGAGGTPRDTDSVVGVQWGDDTYAYPYERLFATPVILQGHHDQRFMVIWSPFANRAMAFKIDREIKIGELQIVSEPANAMLLYNARVGQFINGITGETTRHEKPAGFHASLPTLKTTWLQWRTMHPETVVMAGEGVANERLAGPVQPRYPMAAKAGDAHGSERITFAPATQPVAIPMDAVTAEPANISAGATQLLLFREKDTGRVRAFERRVQQDLFPMFRRKSDPKRPAVMLEDQDSGTEWSADGKAIEGPLKGEQLKAVSVDDGLYWSVMHHWYPDLRWVTPTALPNQAGNLKNTSDAKRRGVKRAKSNP
jgi:hypothetical protein